MARRGAVAGVVVVWQQAEPVQRARWRQSATGTQWALTRFAVGALLLAAGLVGFLASMWADITRAKQRNHVLDKNKKLGPPIFGVMARVLVFGLFAYNFAVIFPKNIYRAMRSP